MPPTEPALEGVCKLLPAPEDCTFEALEREYAALAAEHGPRNVLVLKRHPQGLEAVSETLVDAGAGEGSPRSPQVESVPEHASKVIEEFDPTLERLEYEERIELISLVIDGTSREVPAYLERAADHESFGRDVGQLLLEATRQQAGEDDLERPDDAEEESVARDCLAFLYAMNDRFHAELADRGYVERADVIPRAVDLLEANADGLRDRITASFDAVLAVEFEEFRRLDRRYLAALTSDADLVCLGERHASVERTRVEPGRIDRVVADSLAVERLEADEVLERASGDDTGSERGGNGERTRDEPSHRPVARFLATGERPLEEGATDDQSGSDDTRGSVRRIRARTPREQVRAVATELQSLLERRDWGYDDVAVVVPSIERVPETRRGLREAGIPTATIGTPSLAEDPAVNELYAYVTLQADRERRRNSPADVDPDGAPSEEPERHRAARDRLRARVPDYSPDLLEACDDASVTRSIDRWIARTDLKGRIAEGEDWIDAREQFDGIRRVREIADFVEATDLVAPDWQGFRRMLERTIRYDAPYVHSVETSPPTGGVTVCAAADCKYERRRAVFLLDLIDDRYPGEQFLTQLFPGAWLRELSGYPAVTDPSRETVAETFATADADAGGDPFAAYHAQRARRRLALGVRAATDVCYCCSYERGAGGLRRTYDESRYLREVAATPGLTLESVDATSEARIHGDANAIDALLEQPRGELERVLREASTGGDADLAETEALLQEIAVVLEEGDVDADLAEAVRSQFEFAAGEVIRRE
ncbi:hypothetical protein [Halopiger goleimassiliensis]|uniref:hypothetical protein n=1 Tax=Halopiger goleimassiliensis TaxID=1293048 RepID=UPI0006777A1D|nr:hypothetical protein [Halopiger goleimassiliensis]